MTVYLIHCPGVSIHVAGVTAPYADRDIHYSLELF